MALDQREHLALVIDGVGLYPPALIRVNPCGRSDIGFVALDNLTLATERAGAVIAHGLANAVRHEPSRAISDLERAMELMRAKALLGTGVEAEAQEPLVQRDMTALEHRADADGEFLAAVPAVIPARSHGLAAKSLNRVRSTAERAIGTLRPENGFEEF